VIVGGGVIGLELASSARALGVEVTLLETGDRVMARLLCEQGSDWLADVHRAAGVRLLLHSTPLRIEPGESSLHVHARLADGSDEVIAADLVVAAVGIEVGSPFLRDSGLDDGDGIQVDEFCRSTVDPRCYAAGDVARTPSGLHGRAVRQETWRNADNQARAVAEFICGRTEPYVELPWMWSDQHGHNVQVVGIHDGHDEVVRRGIVGRSEFSLLWLRRGRLIGGALIDQGRDRRPLERLVAAGACPDRRRLADAAIALKEV
jgi:3-phenylpropionate/trans-cinnamate dioxygenase ferredoxin reductase subunit